MFAFTCEITHTTKASSSGSFLDLNRNVINKKMNVMNPMNRWMWWISVDRDSHDQSEDQVTPTNRDGSIASIIALLKQCRSSVETVSKRCRSVAGCWKHCISSGEHLSGPNVITWPHSFMIDYRCLILLNSSLFIANTSTIQIFIKNSWKHMEISR
jgi:hypothetical protein